MSHLSDRVAELPTGAGVYLFEDRKGRVIYVGKAVNLRVRVRQYLAGHDERQMVPFLVRDAVDIQVVVTDTEKEALLLENTLIKKHRPRFNAKLRDDSNFLHLRIDPRKTWPQYSLVRRIGKDGARYFGPYHSASKARSTLAFLQRVFPLRTCTDAVLNSRSRPCLLHQMGRCVAPCVDHKVTDDEYEDLVQGSMELLSGRSKPAMRRLEARMVALAAREEFEGAAKVRDQLVAIRDSVERQKVVDPKLGERDVWGLYRSGAQGCVAILPVREGVMGQPRTALLPVASGDDAPLLSSLLNSAYPKGTYIPPEILLPVRPTDADALEELLGERREGRVHVRVPQRGRKVRLVALAAQNAKVRFERETDADERHRLAMEELGRVLELPEPPRRMECFDNSHLQGTHNVAAMSVFLDGKPARREYRRYRIKTAAGGDDYGMMREIIDRRFRRAVKEDTRADLLVVDGGKGQLGVAMAVLQDLGLHDQAVCGIAKPRTERRKGQRHAPDKIFLPHRKDPLNLRAGNPALRILQHLRDEVHNAAVRYHRSVRRKDNLQSVLEALPGIGPSRRKALLRHLGSAAAVAEASIDQLCEVPGIGRGVAEQLHAAFRG